MKKYSSLLFLIFTQFIFAQSFFLYQHHTNILNPAFIGKWEHLGVKLGYVKYDFQAVQNAPSTTMLSVFSPVSENFNLGISAMNQNIFVERNTQFYADASYKLQLKKNKYLYFGIKTGFANNTSDFQSLNVVNDPVFNQNISKTHFRLGAGVYFEVPYFFVHLSTPNFLLATLQPEIKKNNTVLSENLQEKFQTYFGLGSQFHFAKYFAVSPVFFANIIAGGSSEYNYAAIFSYDTMLDLAFSYKNSDSAGVSLSFYTKKWRIGYAYEFLSSGFMATHEFFLSYNF